MICLRWVLSLRIFVLGTISASLFYTIFHAGHIPGLGVLLILLHIVLSFTILNECQRSVTYHRFLTRHK